MSTEHGKVLSSLGELALFQACSRRELAQIDRSCAPCGVATGRVLCRQGDLGNEFFVIVRGEAIVLIDGVEIARLGGGSFFGEMALLDGGRRVATVQAVSEMDLPRLHAA